MSLSRLITVLEDRLKSLNTREKSFGFILKEILALIEKSEEGKQTNYLIQAVTLIEVIPVFSFFQGGFFSTEKLGKRVLKNHYGVTVLNNDDYKNYGKRFHLPVISIKYQAELYRIHHYLLKLLKCLMQKPEWDFPYPNDPKKNEIMNIPIGLWQKDREKLAEDKKQAFKDFERDYRIEGMLKPHHTRPEIEGLINKLVDKSNYFANDKWLIKLWLQSNGGQFTNRFMDNLLYDKQFSDERCYLFSSESNKKLWYVAENGKICFDYELDIFSLLEENGKFIFLDPLDKDNWRELDPIKISDEVTEFERICPLLRVHATIELAITERNNERIVKPKMIKLNVDSFTNYLLSPIRFLFEDDVSFSLEPSTTLRLG